MLRVEQVVRTLFSHYFGQLLNCGPCGPCDVWLKCRSVDLEHHLPSWCARTCGRVDTWRMLEEGMQRGRRTKDFTYEWQGRSRAALHYEGDRECFRR